MPIDDNDTEHEIHNMVMGKNVYLFFARPTKPLIVQHLCTLYWELAEFWVKMPKNG